MSRKFRACFETEVTGAAGSVGRDTSVVQGTVWLRLITPRANGKYRIA